MSKGRSQDIHSALDSCLLLINEQGLSLDDCLDRFPHEREELKRLLPVAMRLRQGRALSASDELRVSLAARLEGQGNTRRRSSPGIFVTNLIALRSIFRNHNPNRQRRARMIPALITFLVVTFLSMGGLVASADAAGPGDLLFGLDTAIEDIRLSFTHDGEQEVKLRLEFATERLEELKIKIEGEGDPKDIEQALAEFEEAIAAIEALLGDLTPEQRADFEAVLALLRASSRELTEFEFEFEIEDGVVEIELEVEFEGNDGLDDDDLDDDDLDNDDLDDDDLDDDDLDDDDLDDDDLDDDEDCDSSGPGSGDCSDDDDEEECDSSGPGTGDCEDDDEDHHGDDDDNDDDDEDDEEEDD